jgi:hypothetical protein
MLEWITWGHVIYVGLLSGLGSIGFLPVIQTVVWNIVLRRNDIPLATRQQIMMKSACRHLGVTGPPPEPPDQADGPEP